MAERASLDNAIERALVYLAERREVDGSWREFSLPVGTSDQWITAYVAAQAACLDPPPALCAAALAWLRAHGGTSGRYGFNRKCEPDSDSTAWVTVLAKTLGAPPPVDVDWLLAHQRLDGGIATYHAADDAWGVSHACVSPVVLQALPPARAAAGEALVAYLRGAQRADGAWIGFWWRDDAYASYRCRAALAERAATQGLRAPDWRATSRLGVVTSAFSLACALGVAEVVKEENVAAQLAQHLLQLQRADGAWPPSHALRVTPHWARCAEQRTKGRVYPDEAALLTTATALGVLTRRRERLAA